MIIKKLTITKMILITRISLTETLRDASCGGAIQIPLCMLPLA